MQPPSDDPYGQFGVHINVRMKFYENIYLQWYRRENMNPPITWKIADLRRT